MDGLSDGWTVGRMRDEVQDLVMPSVVEASRAWG